MKRCLMLCCSETFKLSIVLLTWPDVALRATKFVMRPPLVYVMDTPGDILLNIVQCCMSAGHLRISVTSHHEINPSFACLRTFVSSASHVPSISRTYLGFIRVIVKQKHSPSHFTFPRAFLWPAIKREDAAGNKVRPVEFSVMTWPFLLLNLFSQCIIVLNFQ